MREPKPEWVAALRSLTGQEGDTIRWNHAVHRWEFVLAGAGGQPQSQFWGQFHNPLTGERILPDPESGMYPFRELDDAGIQEALHNLTVTFVGNPHDGAGTVQRQALHRMRGNRAIRKGQVRDAADGFAEMVLERARRMRGGLQLTVPGTVADTITPP